MDLRLPQDFRELFESLNAKNVEYLLLGGYAVIGHGHVRNTSDLDIAVREGRESVEKLVSAIEDFGFPVDEAEVARLLSPNNIVQMGVEPMLIEILNYMKGVTFDEAYSRRVIGRDGKVEIDVISLSDLIANKKAVGRLKDLADVEGLEKVNELPSSLPQ